MKRIATRNAGIPMILVAALALGLMVGCSGDNDPLTPEVVVPANWHDKRNSVGGQQVTSGKLCVKL